MKKSISHLPAEKQEDLKYIVSLILERIPRTQMIILYGSYATGKYVERDSRIEFGIHTTFMSDYDILVVISGWRDKEIGHALDNIEDIYYKKPDEQTPVQFIYDDIHKLNKDLSDGRYFYTQVKEEGIVLYDTGNYKLARRRKLRYDEIAQHAQEYYNDKFETASGFLKGAKFYYSEENYKLSSFLLHQVCENLFYTVRLVFTLKNNKQHNLSKLLASVRKYSNEFRQLFPQNTEEEKRLFNLLKDAYISARYNPDFKVTKEDIDALLPKVEKLKSITERICLGRIEEYRQKIGDERSKEI